MKIAFVVPSFPKLSETFIINQIKGLIDEGHEVKIFAVDDPEEEKVHDVVEEYNLREKTVYFNPPTSYRDAIKQTPKDLIELGKENLSLFVKGVKLFKHTKLAPRKISALKAFEQEKTQFDIIHFHFGNIAADLEFLMENYSSKFVVSFYGHDVSRLPQQKPGIYDDLFSKADEVIALSNQMKKELVELGCAEQKVKKVPLCIDTSKFQPKKNDRDVPKILTVARFTEKKGLKYAVEALSQIEEDFEYHLVGDGELREQIENQIEEEGLKEKVTFHGWMTNEEVKQKMQESDIFLLPSVTASDGDREGTPTVLLEAQATGLPVVSTHHAGIPEIVDDGETGLLSEEKDVEGLKQNLGALIDDPERRKQMGENGRKLIKNTHSIEEISKRLEKIYLGEKQ